MYTQLNENTQIHQEIMKKHKNYIALGIVLLIGILYYIFVLVTGHGISCRIYNVTGVYCPSCGLTRMVMSLGRGDIKTAFRENAVLMILIPIWVIIAILYKTDIFKKHFNREKMLEILAVISLVIFIVFGVIRNIPYFELLRPI